MVGMAYIFHPRAVATKIDDAHHPESVVATSVADLNIWAIFSESDPWSRDSWTSVTNKFGSCERAERANLLSMRGCRWS